MNKRVFEIEITLNQTSKHFGISACRVHAIEYICVSNLVLIDKVVFLVERGRTHRHTQSQIPLITLSTHRLPPASGALITRLD